MKIASVLIVDNTAPYRHSLRSYLDVENYQVEEAASIQEAKEIMAHIPVDAIMVDLRLTDDDDPSDISGLAVANLASELGIPCIIITGYPTIEATREALRNRGFSPPPAVDFLLKVDGPNKVIEAMWRVPFLGHLTILHISDLHFRSPQEDAHIDQERLSQAFKKDPELLLKFDQERSLRTLRKDLKALRKDRKIGRVQAIVVSGDISYHCISQEFKLARDFLKQLCDELMIPLGRVILIPGNHDINRNEARRSENLRFSKFWKYLKFTEDFYGEQAFTKEKFYRIFNLGRVAIVAFNSCHREGNPRYKCEFCEKEHYHGWIESEQVFQASSELDQMFNQTEVLRLAVCHHQILPNKKSKKCLGDHLWNYDNILKFNLTDGRFHILLHGHGHNAQMLKSSSELNKMPYTLGSGKLTAGDSEKSENQYLILDLGISDSHVIMRRYEPSNDSRLGAWVPDERIEIGGVVPLRGIRLPA